MIDLSELTYDEDFCTTFSIEHETAGTWSRGVYSSQKEVVTVTGIVSPSNAADIETVEEGDRKHGLKTFYTNMLPFAVTNTLTTSDVIVWDGKRYKLLHVFDYKANGYFKAIGELLGADEVG